ncbi:hypothetical protein OF897_09390 [Chryseobacterium formosus]|uniref:Uncharacterized protein n=1 Tax=Chryseobacterium formosus TaxID=1537363 RepID=A0ABT3XPR9_9FLAO|nr:hypothetical protein [Chryseobacterium formosus]MCX8524138.1 hypothetical protein [Chryseobacterium formosus]
MKKALSIILLGLCTLLVTGCKHSAKDPDLKIIETPTEVSNDDIVKETITDRHGDEMEVITNNTKNKVILHLNGQSYELHKNFENSGFSTSDNKYQFNETKNEVTFLKKDVDMVLFHGKRDQASTKMASQ